MEICVPFTVWYLLHQFQALGLSRPHVSTKMAVSSGNHRQMEQILPERKLGNCFVNGKQPEPFRDVFRNFPLNLTILFNAECVGTHRRDLSRSCHHCYFVGSWVIICSAKIFSDISLETLPCRVQHKRHGCIDN